MSSLVCPHWVGYLLASPLRRLTQNPVRILSPYVKRGMTILEIGPGMGFFTLALAEMVGPDGTIVCVDVQKQMIESLRRRARKVGLAGRIITRVCDPDSLGVSDFNGKCAFALAFAVVHEVPDASRLLAEIAQALQSGADCLVAEPKMHVSARKFEQTTAMAMEQGLCLMERPKISGSHTALMRKPGDIMKD